MEQISKKNRINDLDIMKGIGIMLIVLGHLEPGTYLMRFIYSFHLFLFFACSGYVGKRYEKRSFLTIIVQNLKRLAMPYFIWSIFSQIIGFICDEISIIQAGRNVLFLDANVGWNAALWFLYSLFWADLLCALIVKIKRWKQFVLGFLLIGLWFIFAITKVTLPFGLYTVPVAAVFWLIGYWINSYEIIDKIKDLSITFKIVGGGVLLIVNICCGTIFNSVISIYHIQYQNVMLTFISGVAGILFMIVVAILLNSSTKANKLFIFYGQNTLTILCTHYYILRLIGAVTDKLIRHNLWKFSSTPKSILFAIVVLAVYYPLLKMVIKVKENYPKLKYLI